MCPLTESQVRSNNWEAKGQAWLKNTAGKEWRWTSRQGHVEALSLHRNKKNKNKREEKEMQVLFK